MQLANSGLPEANKQCDNQNNKLMWQAASEENPI